MKLEVPTAKVFQPLLGSARYKGAHGGRGSGKSHFFAGLMVERAVVQKGFRGVCIREVQKSLKDSAKRLIEDKIGFHGLGSLFDVQDAEIKTPGDGVIIFQGMREHTKESIKSLEGFNVAWVEEAQTLSNGSLQMLRPTMRNNSELWFSWNPTRKQDPVDHMFRGQGDLTPGIEWAAPTDSVVVQANWRDNPWFPDELEQERLDFLRNTPDQYPHVWEGAYQTVMAGAYFARDLSVAVGEGRVSKVARDPIMRLRSFWDLGYNDSTAIWIAQFVGREIRVLDYIEGQGQPLSYYVHEMIGRGYHKALCTLPHDGSHFNVTSPGSAAVQLKMAGFDIEIVPIQKNAAMLRIEAARRLFPSIWFNEETTSGGLEALGAYHERKDEKRGIGLGPEHDWSSHGADAFGLMCISYRPPSIQAPPDRYKRERRSSGPTSFMGV